MAQDEYPLSNNHSLYNQWRCNISCEYVLRTGRAYPPRRTEAHKRLVARLVEISDWLMVPNPVETVTLLIKEGLLKP